GGIVGDVWLEAIPALSAVRADVMPHLDGADISIVVQHRGKDMVNAGVQVKLWPAQVNAGDRLNPDASSLIPADAKPLLAPHTDRADRVDSHPVDQRARRPDPRRPPSTQPDAAAPCGSAWPRGVGGDPPLPLHSADLFDRDGSRHPAADAGRDGPARLQPA